MSNSIAVPTTSPEESDLKEYGYILGNKIDEGAYSKVREGSDSDKRRVAIKIINKKKCDKEFRLKFLPRELQIFSALQHPNIVEIYDIIHIRSYVYIIMEYAGKDNMHNYLNLRGKLHENRAKGLMTAIISAIEYLHNKNIAHRDLKCSNILINSRNQLKITDFGFARIMKPGELSETYCGSIAYSAPEVLQKIPYDPILQDIWGIGVIIYQMVCGKLPYDEMNIKKMVKAQIRRLMELPNYLSVTCKELINLILEPDVAKRISLKAIKSHVWFTVVYFDRDARSNSIEGPSSHPSNTTLNDIKNSTNEAIPDNSDEKGSTSKDPE